MPTQVSLKNRIPEIILEVPNITAELTLALAGKAADLAKDGAPVETGELRDSIHARPYTTGIGRSIQQQAGVTAEFYWYFNEYGTVGQDAKPFMTPAAEETRLLVKTYGLLAFANL